MIDSFVCGLFYHWWSRRFVGSLPHAFSPELLRLEEFFRRTVSTMTCNTDMTCGINSCLYATDIQISLWSGFTVLTVQPI